MKVYKNINHQRVIHQTGPFLNYFLIYPFLLVWFYSPEQSTLSTVNSFLDQSLEFSGLCSDRNFPYTYQLFHMLILASRCCFPYSPLVISELGPSTVTYLQLGSGLSKATGSCSTKHTLRTTHTAYNNHYYTS